MLRAGLTGGIGSGKSTVSARLADLGAVVLDADKAARARNCLFSRMTRAAIGATASSLSATSRSTAKLSLPFSR